MAKQPTAQQLESGVSLREIIALTPYARNSRTHSPEQVAALAGSIDEFGFVGAIVVRDGTIAKGHGTLAAVQHLVAAGKSVYPAPGRRAGAEPFPSGLIPVQDCSGWSDSQFRAFVIADNRLAESAGWDRDMLALEVADLEAMDFDLDLLGFDPGELDGMLAGGGEPADEQESSGAGSLAARFMAPPFSVLSARDGWWQDRKRAWIAIGIQSELGRGEQLIPNGGGFTSQTRYAGGGQRNPGGIDDACL